MNLGQLQGLFHHLGGFHRDDLGGNRSVNNRGDFGDNLLEVPALFGDEGGIGSHAADDAKVIGFADVVNVSGVDKKFHGLFPPNKNTCI